jgi:hypothetical protein
MTAEDAADLGRCRRGIKPLRIVVMAQYDRQNRQCQRSDEPWP